MNDDLKTVLQGAKYDDSTRRTYVFDYNGVKHYFKGVYVENSDNKNAVKFELLSELYLSRLAKEYYNFNTPIYDIARYELVDGKRWVGVVSQDFTKGFKQVKSLKELYNNYVISWCDCAKNGIFQKMTKGVKNRFFEKLMFDIVTLQEDGTAQNIAFAKKFFVGKFSDLIVYDYGYTSLRKFSDRSTTADIDEWMEDSDCGIMRIGFDSYDTYKGQFINQLTETDYITSKQIENFLRNYGDTKLISKIISQIGSDIKTMDCSYSPKYEELLTYSIDKMTSKLEDALDIRKIYKQEVIEK